MGTSNKFSKDQLEMFKDAFNQIDITGNGVITPAELGTLMSTLGKSKTLEELEEMVKKVDTNKTGTINFQDFLERGEILEAFRFKVFDKNGDCLLAANELKGALNTLGLDITDEEAKDMILLADQDGDGKVNYEEFVAIMEDQQEVVRKESMLAQFKKMDVNGDGLLSPDELRQVVENYQSLSSTEVDDIVKNMIKEADVSGDGLVSFQEYDKIKKDDAC